jgi:hypothetical protein
MRWLPPAASTLFCLIGGCGLLLPASDHQGGSPTGQRDGSVELDAGDGDGGGHGDGDGDGDSDGGGQEDAGLCDVDRDGHRAGGACGGDDCDDSRGDVHPGALPICGDGLVNDCKFRGEEALAAQLTGMETKDGELGIVPPRKLAVVPSPLGVRTLAIAMAPQGNEGGGIWIAHLAGQAALERVPALMYASGDAPVQFADVALPEPALPFRDVTTLALGAGEGDDRVDFALFAAQPFDGDGDATPDTSGWAGTLGPAPNAGTIHELSAGTAATIFPRAVIAGGSLQYPQHYIARFEARTSGNAHFMTAFRDGEPGSDREVPTDARGIVASRGLVDAVATRGAHLLLHEPGDANAYVWPYVANPGGLVAFNLSTQLETEVTGAPGFAYLGRESSQDQYALLAAGRGEVVAAVVSCARDNPGACTLALGGTTVRIPLDHPEDEARAVTASTLRESALVAVLTRVLPNSSSREHLDLTLLALSGIMRTFTVFPQGFAGTQRRVLDAQIASMRSALSEGGSATTIGYAALVENDDAQDELYYGMLRACDAR